MTAQPAPKTQELENNINYFFDNYLRLTNFDILRLKKKAKYLIKIDAATAYDYLGRIAGLENNRKDVISNYEKAISLPSNNCINRLNYSIALMRCGLNDLALEEARKVFNKFPNDKDVLSNLFYRLIDSTRFNEAHTLLSEIEDNEKIELVNHASKIFEEVHLKDEDAQYLQKLAYSVIEKNNIYYFNSTASIIDNCVCFTLYVDLPVEEIFDINWDLAGILANGVDDMRCDVLNFEYSSIEVLRERREYERSI